MPSYSIAFKYLPIIVQVQPQGMTVRLLAYVVWPEDIGSRYFGCCELCGGASVNQICLSGTSHDCLIGLESGDFGGQVSGLELVACWTPCIAGCKALSVLMPFCLGQRWLPQDIAHQSFLRNQTGWAGLCPPPVMSFAHDPVFSLLVLYIIDNQC